MVKNNIGTLPASLGKISQFLLNGMITTLSIINETFFKLYYPPFIRSQQNYL